MHGVVTDGESRQQLYTMMTRGRSANHLYIAVVGDGDPHAVLQPDNVHLRSTTELLERIVGRDGSPRSASTLQREQQDPAVRLGAAAARYLDALHLAAEHLARPEVVANLDRNADRMLNGLTGEPAWPTLRGHLLLLAAAGDDPISESAGVPIMESRTRCTVGRTRCWGARRGARWCRRRGSGRQDGPARPRRGAGRQRCRR